MKNKKYTMFFKIKQEDLETGEFTGMASVTDIEDLHGDIIENGAFKRTLDHNNGLFTLLWQHMTRSPIGIVNAREIENGLEVKGKLTMVVQKAIEALALMKDKAVRGLSIGFQSIKEDVIDGVTHIKEVKLWEVSLVTFGANPFAKVFGVKDAEMAFATPDNILINLIGHCELMKDDKESFEKHKSLIGKAVSSINALLESHKAVTDPMKDLLAKMRETLADVKSSNTGKRDPEPADKKKTQRPSEPDLSEPIKQMKQIVASMQTKEK